MYVCVVDVDEAGMRDGIGEKDNVFLQEEEGGRKKE